ncbi:unnamed protein product [Cylicocyclus nassatus]|uniref:Uncharacterized protein n=1 Tax=Cylicocyclus nassatus TaxID=53992 RepID=A0AA36DL03_CYLNA|nr:unnamed protein product [Cylicocyclus nassatus]
MTPIFSTSPVILNTITKLGFSERNAFQVADKLKRCLTITKKYISNKGEGAAGQRYHFPSYLRPLERKVREEYLKHRVDATFDEAGYLDPEFEINPSARAEDLLGQDMSGGPAPHTYASVASVLPFTAGIPASHAMGCKRPFEEDNDYFFKKRRLLDAKRKLKERKRYLKEMKIKYWEQKMKNELNCINMSFQK